MFLRLQSLCVLTYAIPFAFLRLQSRLCFYVCNRVVFFLVRSPVCVVTFAIPFCVFAFAIPCVRFSFLPPRLYSYVVFDVINI